MSGAPGELPEDVEKFITQLAATMTAVKTDMAALDEMLRLARGSLERWRALDGDPSISEGWIRLYTDLVDRLEKALEHSQLYVTTIERGIQRFGEPK